MFGDWWTAMMVGAALGAVLGAVLMWRLCATRARRGAEAAARQAGAQADALETALRENASLQADLDRAQADWHKEREQWQSTAAAWEGQRQDSVLKADQARARLAIGDAVEAGLQPVTLEGADHRRGPLVVLAGRGAVEAQAGEARLQREDTGPLLALAQRCAGRWRRRRSSRHPSRRAARSRRR